MPNDPLVWMVAILVGGVVVAVALVLGGAVEVGVKPLKLSFRRKKNPAREQVSVLEEAEIEEAEVGNVTGMVRQTSNNSGDDAVRDIDVARRAKVKGGKIGDITGAIVTGKKPDGPDDGQN